MLLGGLNVGDIDSPLTGTTLATRSDTVRPINPNVNDDLHTFQIKLAVLIFVSKMTNQGQNEAESICNTKINISKH